MPRLRVAASCAAIALGYSALVDTMVVPAEPPHGAQWGDTILVTGGWVALSMVMTAGRMIMTNLFP